MKLWDRFKEWLGMRTLLKEHMPDRRPMPRNLAHCVKVGVVYLATDEAAHMHVRNYVKKMKEELGLHKIQCIGYSETKTLPAFLSARLNFDAFCQKDINWYRIPGGNTVNNFIAEEFDVLIDLTLEDYLPIQYITAKSRARFKVGRLSDGNKRFLDMLIDTAGAQSLPQLIGHVDKYLLMYQRQARTFAQLNMDHRFRGLGVALVTPFRPNGAIDYAGLQTVVEHQINGGIDYLVVLGTTGESVTLSAEEKKQVAAHVIEVAKNRVPIVLGVGGNNTAEVVQQLQTYDLSGVDGILSVSPYYNKPTQEEIYQHYRAIAQASLVPIILYNVPGRTMSNITAETTLRLARDFKNIVGIKEASGNLDQIATIIKHRPKDFLVISGDDALTLPILALGGDGVISVIGNALPAEFSRLVESAMKDDHITARREHLRLIELMTYLFVEGNPGGIKEALKILGLCGNTVRLPLVPVSEATSKKIYQALADAEVVKL